jgi:ubiquinone biosynthesis protein UbiJ
MLHSLRAQLAPALAQPVAERLTLLVNHLLAAEPVAAERLRPHAGRTIEVTLTGWPRLLPPPPAWVWRVTAAGLLEWCATALPAAADLGVRIDAANPGGLLVRTLGGQPPAAQIDGDAQFAADVHWLIQNLRWDAAADLERAFGPLPAGVLMQLGSSMAAGLRGVVEGAAALRERLRPRGP